MSTKYRLLIASTLLIISSSIFVSSASAQRQSIDILFFYGMGCPHCARMETFLTDLTQKNPTVNVQGYETYFNDESRQLFQDLMSSLGQDIRAVPTTLVGNQIFVGFSDKIAKEIEEKIEACAITPCQSALNAITKDTTGSMQQLTIPAVLGAAVVDAINPCAFAVLIILITTILSSGRKRRALFAGLAFSLSIFISYFLMGLGLYTAIQAAGLTHTFYAVIAVLAIIIGLFNLKDYFWYGKWFVMEVPMSWRPRMKALIHGVTSVPGAFFIGFAVSLFLLPCTSGPYIVILGLLAKATTRNYAIALLVLYNMIFVTPMVLITCAVYFGLTTTERAEEWRTNKIKVLHLIAGLIILALGIGMLAALKFGYV